MIGEDTARALQVSAIRLHRADAELRSGHSPWRKGVVALATECVQAHDEHATLLARAYREEQSLDEGQ